MSDLIMPVILCGGSGTRLWPLSRAQFPKQFVPFDNGASFFGKTLERIKFLPQKIKPVLVCNDEHKFHALKELENHHFEASMILEPSPRNTAPAIALAALSVQEQDPYLIVLPSDHFMPDSAGFCEKVLNALPLAKEGRIVAFGIKPDFPATGYGYIEYGEPFLTGYKIQKFLEKPDKDIAIRLLSHKCCLWNCGIFLVRSSIYLDELRKLAPEIYAGCRASWDCRKTEANCEQPGAEAFNAIKGNSIDYAVMEKTDKAAVFPLDLEWSDLGTWDAVYEKQAHDPGGNVIHGDVLNENVKNCYLDSRHRLLAAIDVENLVIVETQDAVLVTSRDNTQNVKTIVERLDKGNRPESKLNPIVRRPWGSFEVLVVGDRFQAKRIVVNPGASLSLQMHHHRAEHWVVVRGTAEVVNGDDHLLLTENQSTYIPIGKKHSLKNPGLIPLVIIEIQSGAYLGENDIIRFADIYGR